MKNSELNLSELLKNATESAAISPFPLFGKGKKDEADALAVNAMRNALNLMNFRSRVIIGEGEKDNAPMLYEGEILGSGDMEIDIAVDPLECTTNFSKGLPNSLSVLAYSEKGGMKNVPGTYMEQWIAGPRLQGEFDPLLSLPENIEKISFSNRKAVPELQIVVQDRPRHTDLIRQLRDLGCSITLIDSGSVTATLDICLGLGHYDALIGTYGAPEGLICALVAKATGSEMKAILRPHEEKYKIQWEKKGEIHGAVLDKSDLVTGNKIGFVATGISTNHILPGLRKTDGTISGSTIVIDSGGVRILKFERKI